MGRGLRPFAALALLAALGGCGNLSFGDNPGHEFPKETGPLTVPPPLVRNAATR